jgi:hypothetical protein
VAIQPSTKVAPQTELPKHQNNRAGIGSSGGKKPPWVAPVMVAAQVIGPESPSKNTPNRLFAKSNIAPLSHRKPLNAIRAFWNKYRMSKQHPTWSNIEAY